MALRLGLILPAALAHDHRLQFFQFDEIVGLAPEFIGHHWWLRTNGRTDRNSTAPALYRFHQFAEIAVAGENYDVIHPLRHLHHVNGELDIHITFDPPPPLRVGIFLERLGNHRK